MKDALTKAAQTLAARAGAEFAAVPGVAHNPDDHALATLASALTERLSAVGAELIAVARTESGLAALVRDDHAQEPVSPAAFQSVVRRLAWNLLGEVWEGRLVTEPARRRTALVA